MASISKACLEISNSIRGFRLSRSQPETGSATSASSSGNPDVKGAAGRDGCASRGLTVTGSVTNTITRAIKSATSRVKAFDKNGQMQTQQQADVMTASVDSQLQKKASIPNGSYDDVAPPAQPDDLERVSERLASKRQHYLQQKLSIRRCLWEDEQFLHRFFWYFSPSERCYLTQVCSLWKTVLYNPCYWVGVTPVYKCRTWAGEKAARMKFLSTLEERAFDSVCLFGALDCDVPEFVDEFPYCRQNIASLSIRCSNVTDIGLEMLLDKMAAVAHLEISGCNEVTEAGLWSCLSAKITSLTISDCINIADDSVGAVAQLLPALQELNLQAYHVTDNALSFFTPKQSCTLYVLRLQSCWEITNHGIVNVIHSLPNLTVLSLSGCSKITDDGVELIAENLRKIRSLDLSWCPRITDAALEYIACDLGQLEELILDSRVYYEMMDLNQRPSRGQNA
ncbi:hypothetical protein LSH36_217g02014 [Paralvinella palmiformis]|uniref:F-box/LRR-repeat protein 15-like leucin rich repeat domain-containing protein n=1 Tax=Paralvinella palmiformis TaxID=53620 RepID=A0AAD9JP01_9ANNE|nr:hypothetical protein LSH36_217g02014 [Paralvinella palmiformis]